MPQKFLSIKNFEKYQHYKHRNPPWIKLYNSLLDDYGFSKLPTGTKYLYLGLLILCSRHDNRVPNDCTWIARALHMDPSEIDLSPLYRSGLLLASRNHVASILHENALSETERETEKSRVETDSPRVASLPAKPASRGSVFPEGWTFGEREQALATAYGLNVHRELAAFRDHHTAKGTIFRDWSAAFRNWLRNAVKFASRGGAA